MKQLNLKKQIIKDLIIPSINQSVINNPFFITCFEMNPTASQFVISDNEGIIYLYRFTEKKRYVLTKTLKSCK